MGNRGQGINIIFYKRRGDNEGVLEVRGYIFMAIGIISYSG